MRTLKMILAYDGTAYGGWQVQPNATSIQAELERVILRMLGERVRITASGRTDAGVHAAGQVASFRLASDISPSNLLRAMNSRLPQDIRVLHIDVADDFFHAIRDATRKRYRYRIWNANVLDVFHRAFVWYLPIGLDVDAMREALETLRGERDFACFQRAGSPRKTTTRNMLDVSLQTRSVLGGQELTIELESNGFLYNMARNIVGTLVWIGRGKQTPQWIPELIAGRDRRHAGMCAPAKGLTLLRVWYDHSPLDGSLDTEPSTAAIADDEQDV